MTKLEVHTYKPMPPQRLFHQSDAFLRFLQGGFGAGKTLAGVWEAIDVSMAYPRNFGLIARKTYRELADSTKKTFFDVCPPELIDNYRARDEEVTLVNGSKIIFRSLDDPQKMRSLNLGWFYVDEATEIDDEEVPLMLIGRLRLSTVPWRGGWFTSNPSHVEHWTYKWFVERARSSPERYFMVTATSYDNPHLPREHVRALEEEYSPQWIKRYLMGEFGFVVAGSPVYEAFNESIHVVDRLEWLSDRPMYRAWDFGLHHPAVLFSQVGSDRQWLILREDMGTMIMLNKYADHIVTLSNELFPGAKFIDVGDPAGLQRNDKDMRSSIDLLRDEFNIKVLTRRHPKKRLIELVDRRLSMIRKDREGKMRPMVQINLEGCKQFIEGLRGGYAWPKARDGKIRKEEPMEDGFFEHLQDCGQYAAAAIFYGGTTEHLDIKTPTWDFNMSGRREIREGEYGSHVSG